MKLKHMPLMMPWKGKDIPNGVIEVNQKCNLSCDGCYKKKINYEKSIEQIKKEIDLIRRKRNLATIALVGGEPTLYKNLPDIISYIASIDKRPILLTNGTMLNDSILKEYKKAGLARIGIHIDKHQNIRLDSKKVSKEKDLNDLRKKYLDLCEKYGIGTSLQLTLYRDSLEDIMDVIEFSKHQSSNLAGIFFTLYSPSVDMGNKKRIEKMKYLALTNLEIIKIMKDKENAYPALYIPSSIDKKAFRWIFYICFSSIDKQGKIHNLYLDPRNKRQLLFFIELQRMIKGRYSFDDPRKNFQNYISLVSYGFFSLSLKTFFRASNLLIKSLVNKNLKIFNILFQEGPKYLGNGKYDICNNCPDMTVRNNKMMPVCLADFIEPIK